MSRAKKTKIDGVVFDSKMEADYYCQLKLLVKAKEISNLSLQPEFELIPSFKLRKRIIRKMQYTPDFFYLDKDGNKTVVEVKGYAKKDYLMRRKLFLHCYGEEYIFIEVKKKGNNFIEAVY